MQQTAVKTTLSIAGMNCTHCAAGIEKQLKKIGLNDVNVDFSTSSARFIPVHGIPLTEIISTIEKLGYQVSLENDSKKHSPFNIELKFLFCTILSLPLLLHMFSTHHLLHNQWFQLALSTPVFIVGLMHFGKSAFNSLRARDPNMDVLIIIGATAAYAYSLTGTLLNLGPSFQFYETATSIITIVLLGNVLEKRAVRKTSSAIEELGKVKASHAKLISGPSTLEVINTIDAKDIKIDDLLLVNSGDQIPTDGIVYWGSGECDESMVSGESAPVAKQSSSKVIGGTVLVQGSIKMRATEIGENTVLSQIISMVRDAQSSKPQIQRIGDRVSFYFVPSILAIAALTFLIVYLSTSNFQNAMLQSIAVLVIACPCAMGLATPTAVMVGVGSAVRNGILIRGGSTLEKLACIKTVVFDKTGTLTNGDFRIAELHGINIPQAELAAIVVGLEKHSSHPLAKALIKELGDVTPLEMRNIHEEKGFGIKGSGLDGRNYMLGSHHTVDQLTTDSSHNVYVKRDNELVGWIDLADEPQESAKDTITRLIQMDITPVMLSGDSSEKCQSVAAKIGITQIHAQKTPHEKLKIIQELQKESSLAFVGDGINDAPSLARADVGISLSDASQAAIQSAQVVLLAGRIDQLVQAIEISKRTFRIIKQNLFWAFVYNIVAIPVAACGYLTPAVAALTMGFSDIVVIANSLRLRVLSAKRNSA